MRKIISFMHLSLDGFVAGPNGEMDWIKFDAETVWLSQKQMAELFDRNRVAITQQIFLFKQIRLYNKYCHKTNIK